jgi:hypothetical protein
VTDRKYVNSAGKQNQPQLPPPGTLLTDQQWAQITAYASLPTSARLEIDEALERYRAACRDEIVPPESLKKVRRAKEQAQKLLRELVELDRMDDLEKRQPTERDLQHVRQIALTCDQLHNCFCALEYVEERLESRGRNSYGPLPELVADLDSILFRHLGLHVSYATNANSPAGRVRAVVDTVCNLSRSRISDRKVRGAIESYLQRSRRTSTRGPGRAARQ